MGTQSTMTLTLNLDMPLALRLARYEVETGEGLDQLLVTAIAEWESQAGDKPREQVDRRIYVEFRYAPRGQGTTWVARGRYDPRADEVEITEFERTHLVGFRAAPSTVASEVVREINPTVDPNRNGLLAWREVGTGRTLKEIVRNLPRRVA